MEVKATDRALERYCDRLRAAGLDAPWSRPGPLIASKPTRVQACHWRWAEIRPLLTESADFMVPGRGAERRILRLANPGVPERTSTHTLSGAVQYLLPGENAPSHRHTPNAIRFMIEGRGACTIVEGEKCAMSPGDLVLTPSMSWHEHDNEGAEPVMWFDGLDSPVVRYLEILAMESGPADAGHDHGPAEAGPYDDQQEARAHPAGSGTNDPPVAPGFSRASAVASGFSRAPSVAAPSVASGLSRTSDRTILYPWASTYPALLARADRDANPFDDVLMEYRDPVTGASVLPTLGCYVQLIRAGARTRAHRQTSSAVYHVFRGSGFSTIDGARYDWRAGDFFAVPPLVPHMHGNDGAEPAILFSLQDVPLLTSLGLYHEWAS